MPNVTVAPPSTIKVQVGNQFSGTVQSIAYGGRTIKSATDLVISDNAKTGDVLFFNAATKNFEVGPIVITVTNIDAGLF